MIGSNRPKDLRLGEFDFALMRGGPIYGLLVRAGIARPGQAGIALRILFFIAVTWIPLALITICQGAFLNPAIKVPFLCDFAEQCRFLFVLPLLIVAEGVIEPWLGYILAQLRFLVSESDSEKFKENVTRALRGRDSLPVELLLILLAFIRPYFDTMTLSANITTWRTITTAAGSIPTPAFLWYLYVAKPLIALLWFRWIWKYIIWSLLLSRTSKLALRVIPTHPDRMGGLGFITVAQTNFAVLYVAVAAQAASYIGEEIVFESAKLMSFKYLIFAVVMLAPILFVAPCLAFSSKLINCRKRALLEYGALADQYTKDFHEKWIEGKREENEPLVGSSDIQSLADLGNSFETVRSMKVILVSKSTIVTFLVAAALPFTPLLLTVYPFDELLARLVKMVL